MAQQFKAGDTIRKIMGDCSGSIEGKEYVLGLNPAGILKTIDPTDGEFGCSCTSEWELVTNKKTQVKPKATKEAKALFNRVVLPDVTKQSIEAAISQIDNNDLIFNEWGFGETIEKGKAVALLFYGKPGTGKTMMAQAIAEMFGRELKVIGSAELRSSQPGQTERNIQTYFKDAQENNKVLLFDECDSMIGPRNECGMILAAEINQVLTSLEQFEGIVIFTTNRLLQLDQAFERRVALKVEFELPNADQRVEIWRNLIPKKCPLHKDVDFKALGALELAGGNIKNVILNAARKAAFEKKKKIELSHFVEAAASEIKGIQDFNQAKPRMAKERSSMGVDTMISTKVDTTVDAATAASLSPNT